MSFARKLRSLKCFTLIAALITVFLALVTVELSIKYLVINSNDDDHDHYNRKNLKTVSSLKELDSLCVLPKFPEPYPLNLKKPQNYSVTCNYTADVGISIHSGKLVLNNRRAKCFYNHVIRTDDFHASILTDKFSIRHGDSIPSDYFIVTCDSRDAKKNHNERLPLMGIKPKQNLIEERRSYGSSQSALGYNVVLLGFDSVSRLSFLRYLPKSYDYFLKELDGTVLNKHNILGDGTTVNLLGMLTGYKEVELPDARRGRKGAQSVDRFPWIFKDFKRSGYITQHAEDNQYYGTFQFRLLGFDEPPTDHYARPFTYKFPNHAKCSGPTPRHILFFDYLREFHRVYDKTVKKFSFIFHSESSHNVLHELRAIDTDLVNLLKEFKSGGDFEESILFLFGDHGARYSSHRSTMQGKYEERLPFFGLHLPDSLKKRHPEYLHNFRRNSHLLTSHLDIHATLLHILGLPPINANRSTSLFKQIPADRTCDDMSIEPHWCVCSNWKRLDSTNPKVLTAARAAVDFINSIVADVKMCVKHKLIAVSSAEISESNQALLAFKRSADRDGYRPDLSDKMKATRELYRITFSTSPSNALFEMTGYLDLKSGRYHFSEKEVSRINKYGPFVKCIERQFPHLRIYCVCKDSVKVSV